MRLRMVEMPRPAKVACLMWVFEDVMPIKSIRLDPNLEPKQIYKHHENLGCQIGTVHGSWLQNRLMTLSRNRPLQINQFPADIGNPWPCNQLSTHWVPAQQVQSHHQVHAHLP